MAIGSYESSQHHRLITVDKYQALIINSNIAVHIMINTFQNDLHTDIYTGDASYIWLADEIQRTYHSSESLIVLCIGIKPSLCVEGEYSPAHWDAALQQAMLRIRTTVRMRDRVFHRYGDEIIVVLPHTNIEGAITLTNRLIRRLTEQSIANGPSVSIAVHVGGSLSGLHSSAKNMIQLAQDRMSMAHKLQRKYIFADEPQPVSSQTINLNKPANPNWVFAQDMANWLQERTVALHLNNDNATTQIAIHDLDLRWNEIRQALDWSIAQNLTELSLRMVVPVARYCLLQNFITDGLHFVEGVLNISGLTNTEAYIQVMITSGEFFMQVNDLASAADRFHTAFTLSSLPNTQYTYLTAQALGCMGIMYLKQNRQDYAICYAQKALAACRRAENGNAQVGVNWTDGSEVQNSRLRGGIGGTSVTERMCAGRTLGPVCG